MAIRTYRPTSPARRGMTTRDKSEITSKRVGARSLLTIKRSKSGRNNQGRITVRHRGGGVKRFYRQVDHKLSTDAPVTVEQIEYDPNRSAHLALVREESGRPHYVIAAVGLKPGAKVASGSGAAIETGNRLPLSDIPVGSFVYGVEMYPGRGGQLARSAGAKAQLIAREANWAQVRLPSGEVRKVHVSCQAHIGSVGNDQHQNVKYGSAGRRRLMGHRPSVRGKAMNPADHPMGGGEGQTGPGRIPKTPWGQVALGLKTRRRKSTAKFIIRSRHESKRR
jgi:large subunit ribosomal protein L2